MRGNDYTEAAAMPVLLQKAVTKGPVLINT